MSLLNLFGDVVIMEPTTSQAIDYVDGVCLSNHPRGGKLYIGNAEGTVVIKLVGDPEPHSVYLQGPGFFPGRVIEVVEENTTIDANRMRLYF